MFLHNPNRQDHLHAPGSKIQIGLPPKGGLAQRWLDPGGDPKVLEDHKEHDHRGLDP